MPKTFVCDFETTVYEGQEETEVWASASVELGTEEVVILHSIEAQLDYFLSLDCDIIAYYHNLKFDGSFWLNYLLRVKGFTQAITRDPEHPEKITFCYDNEMPDNSIKYLISSMGSWYSLTVYTGGHYITFRDSLKLLPFSVKRIGKSFKTKHQKLEMEYKGKRYAGCPITSEEYKYIANDVLVVKEALEIMFEQGHDKLTIGACCLEEFKRTKDPDTLKEIFPDLRKTTLDEAKFGSPNAERYIRNAYRGGWCYVVKGKQNQLKRNGCTADVNSLYPSMMSSESGNRYPIGSPYFVSRTPLSTNEDILRILKAGYVSSPSFYFLRVKTRFKLREGYLPFIQIKRNAMYDSNENLERSDVYLKKTGKYYPFYVDKNGVTQEARPTLTMSCTDWELFNEHYELYDTEILDGCFFETTIGIFDEYIEKYKHMKLTSEGALRELAKLFLNNLYGKLATSTDSSFKYAYIKPDGSLGYTIVKEDGKKPVYIPCGAAITSYARNFTIRAAQKNYYGVDKQGFIYADTDSIHCDLPQEALKGVPIHDKNFCHWKVESIWDEGIFVRQKTYIERMVVKDGKPLDKPLYNVKCAGMPERSKALVIASLQSFDIDKLEEEARSKISPEGQAFVRERRVRSLEDFKLGLKVPDKLLPKNIKGGIVLQETSFEMR